MEDKDKPTGTLSVMADGDEPTGTTTVVKKESTDDLDVVEQVAASKTEEEEEQPQAKPEKKVVAADDNDDDDELDFKSLSPKQQRAIGRVYKEKRDDRKRIRALETQIRELMDRTADNRGNATAVESETISERTGLQRPTKPDPSKYKTDADFMRAEEEYEDKLYEYRKALEQVKKQEEELKAERDRVIISYNDAVEKFIETHPDYEEAMDQDTPMSKVMFGAVLENGPALGYYLAKNPEVASKIYKMSANEAYKSLMKIVVKLEENDEEPPAQKKRQQEPPKKKQDEPPQTLSGKGGAPPPTRAQSFREREKAYAKEHPGELLYEP